MKMLAVSLLPAVALMILTSSLAAQDTRIEVEDMSVHAQRNVLSKIDRSQIFDVAKTKIGVLHLYRVRFDLNNEQHEMLVSRGGTILRTMVVSPTALDVSRLRPLQEDLTRVHLNALPQKAQLAVKEHVSAPHVVQIKEADLGPQTFYDVLLDEDSPYRQLRVMHNGECVQKMLPTVAAINSWNATVLEAAGAERPAFETKKVFLEDLSPELQQAIKTHSGGKEVDRILQMTVNGKTQYEVKGKTDFKMDENGAVLKED